MYPYEYMDSFEKASENEVPDRCNFFSSLKDKCMSEKDYSHTITVWNTFKTNLMDDYHDLYLKTDVLFWCNDMLSQYCSKIGNKYGINICGVNK